MNNPVLSGVSPQPNDTGVVLKPVITVIFSGAGLIDPRSWGDSTFALVGPGDVVYSTGPGTILNSGIIENPYTLIDDVIIRESLAGQFALFTSGNPPASGIDASLIGVSGTIVYGTFIPDVPLHPFTKYSVVLVGQDALDWLTTERVFPGVTSWTSDPEFSGISDSGRLVVRSSYQRTLHSNVWNSGTEYNDTFTVEIISGSDTSAPRFVWSKASTGGVNLGTPSPAIQSLGDGLTFQFSGVFVSGDIFELDVYIPQPLLNTYRWDFSTESVSGSTPPEEITEPPLIIDLTPGGGFGPVTSGAQGLALVAAHPPNLAFGVRPDLPLILLEFNQALSGYIASGEISIHCDTMMGMPNISGTGSIALSGVEISGNFLKLWL